MCESKRTGAASTPSTKFRDHRGGRGEHQLLLLLALLLLVCVQLQAHCRSGAIGV